MLEHYISLYHICRYDPLQNSWESLAEMQEKRCSFSVVVLDGKIYAIGGHCDPDYIGSVEQYCPITNSWRYVGRDIHFSKQSVLQYIMLQGYSIKISLKTIYQLGSLY